MKKIRFKVVALFTVAVMLVSVLSVPLTVFADDSNSPPAEKPEGYIRDLAGNLDFTGDFSGGNCLSTKKTFPMLNLKKYDFLEFDIYLDCSNSQGAIRFYFLDDKYKDQNAGRGFYDFWTDKGVWTHIKVPVNGFECGYDMNGNTERMCGTMFERRENAKKTDRIIVTNMCLTANHVVSPDTMPDRLLINVGVDVDLTATEGLEAVNTAKSIKETDFTYGDFVEMDYYVESKDGTDSSAFALYNAEGKKSVYEFDVSCNGWNHLKIPYSEFKGDADLTKIVKYGCDKFITGNVYHFANICITGVAIPGTYPENTSVKLPAVLDYTGTKSAETVTPFGITVDMTAHDYIEFDLYVETEGEYKQPYFFVYDSGYSGSGGPLAANRKQKNLADIENKKWNHVRISVYSLMSGNGKGNVGKAAGIYISNLSANTRYIVADICFTDALQPEKNNIFTEVKDVFGNVQYRGNDYNYAQAFFNEDSSEYDASKNGYVEFDFYALSNNDKETVNFGLADATYNGTNGVSTVSRTVNTNEWKHLYIPVSEFKGSADLTKAVSFVVVSPAEGIKYIIFNVSFTDVLAPEMNNDFELKKELGVDWDYSGKDPYATVKRFDTVNLNECGYVEFDICVLSSSAKRSLRIFFLDETFSNGNTGRGFFDFVVNSCSWQHVVIPCSAFDTGYGMNGNRTKVNGFHFDNLVNGERVIVKNTCLTVLEEPELETKYEFKNSIGAKINYFGKDPYATVVKIGSTDMMQYDFTEFDIFVYGNDTSVRLFFIDSTFAGKGTGCGFYDFSATPGQWKHIVISNASFDTGYGMGGNRNDVCGYMIDGLAAGNQYIITNMCYTNVDVPEMNNKYELKKSIDDVSWCFSGISDPYMTKKSMNTVDATQYQYLEFDICIESASQTVPMRLFFFDDTYKNQNAGRGFTDLRITANQWNHIVFELKNFNTGYDMNGNLKKLSGFILDAISRNNSYYIFNLCFTNRKQSVPFDEGDRAERPDKDARYISGCDVAVDTLGSWNSDRAYFTANYKTEGKKSIALNVDNQPENANNFKFGFDNPADFSKTASIRFDLMIDDIKLAKQTTASVTFSSSRRATSQNHTYELNFNSMKEGWNSVELPISAFSGDADLSSISCFTFVLHSELASDDFYVLCLDNLRASKTFTVLEGKSESSDDDPDDFEDDFDIDDDGDDDYTDSEENNEPGQQSAGKTVKKVIRRYKKAGNGGSNIDLIVLISVSAVCGVLIISGLVLLLITKRKLDKLAKE